MAEKINPEESDRMVALLLRVMEEMRPEEMAVAEVEARTVELMDEFNAHYQEFCELEGVQADRSLVFQAWTLQKLAGIQVAVELLGTVLQDAWRMSSAGRGSCFEGWEFWRLVGAGQLRCEEVCCV